MAAPTLGVIHLRSWQSLWRTRPLDRAAVLAALTPLFAEVDGFQESFGQAEQGSRFGGRVRREIELRRERGRAAATWTVHLRGEQVLHVSVTIRDLAVNEPAEAYQAELPETIGPLRELAAACGARLFCGGVDLTLATIDEISELMASDTIRLLRPAETDHHRQDH